MLVLGTRERSERTRRETIVKPDLVGAKSEWMDSGKDPNLSPTIFLIEQPAGMTLPAHFHHNNQFQLFVAGSGKIGPRKLQPLVVHYAGAYTAYGPLVAGPEGLKYFTVRTAHEAGGVIVAKSDGFWKEGPRRHATSKPLAEMDADGLSGLEAIEEEVIFPPSEDGLAAYRYSVPPGGVLPAPDRGEGEGAFFFVVVGELVLGTVRLKRWESFYISSDEEFPEIGAGAGGAQCLFLVPPKLDPAYRLDGV
jgi:hypothetical protein